MALKVSLGDRVKYTYLPTLEASLNVYVKYTVTQL